jgi:hypothetical protein
VSVVLPIAVAVAARKGRIWGGAPPEIYKEIRIFFSNVFNFLLKIPIELVDLFILSAVSFILFILLS